MGIVNTTKLCTYKESLSDDSVITCDKLQALQINSIDKKAANIMNYYIHFSISSHIVIIVDNHC